MCNNGRHAVLAALGLTLTLTAYAGSRQAIDDRSAAGPVSGQRLGKAEVQRGEVGADNALVNGDFSAGLAPWIFYTNGIGSVNLTGDGVRYSLVSPGSNAQVFQPGVHLEGGTRYKLSFSARSRDGRDIQVRVIRHGWPYNSYGLSQRVDLQADEQHFELEFTSPPGDKADARVQFWSTPYDLPGDWYELADVELEKVDGGEDDEDDEDELSFSVAELYFELNNTDGDLGIHSLIDGDPWKALVIENPDEEEILEVELDGTLAQQGLTEFFFESAEPPFDELAPADFFARFPEGVYEIEGITTDGEEMEALATVTQLIPAPADGFTVNGILLPENCDVEPLPSTSGPFVVRWDPVTHSHPTLGRANEPITVVRYELVLEREEPQLKFGILLPADVTEVTIPALFGSGEEVKIEILVREESGNQTATETCFETED